MVVSSSPLHISCCLTNRRPLCYRSCAWVYCPGMCAQAAEEKARRGSGHKCCYVGFLRDSGCPHKPIHNTPGEAAAGGMLYNCFDCHYAMGWTPFSILCFRMPACMNTPPPWIQRMSIVGNLPLLYGIRTSVTTMAINTHCLPTDPQPIANK